MPLHSHAIAIALHAIAIVVVASDEKEFIKLAWRNGEATRFSGTEPGDKIIAFIPIPEFPVFPESDDYYNMENQEWER